MGTLDQVVREEVAKYASNGRGINVILFPIFDAANATYSVIAVDYPAREQYAMVVVLARIVNDKVVIEEDTTDKKLVAALLARGIDRDQIVLAYAGEPIPDAERIAW